MRWRWHSTCASRRRSWVSRFRCSTRASSCSKKRARVFQQRDLRTNIWATEIELVGELLQRVPRTLALERQDKRVVGRVAANAGARPPDAHGRALERQARPDLLLELRQQIVARNQVDANPRSDQRPHLAGRQHRLESVLTMRQADDRAVVFAEDVCAQPPYVVCGAHNDVVGVGLRDVTPRRWIFTGRRHLHALLGHVHQVSL